MRQLYATIAGAALALGVVITGGGAQAASYAGSLQGAVGGSGTLNTTGNTWSSTGTILEWNVTNENGSYPGLWVYSYTFKVPSGSAGGISHVINELSDGVVYSATDGLLPGTTTDASPSTGAITVGTHTQQQGNPNLPGNVYGIKINTDFGTASDRTFIWQLVSNHAPMWGNFYAKGGGNPVNSAWNAGFLLACADKHDVGNGNSCLTVDDEVAYKVLVPNEKEMSPVPVPAAIPLFLSGLAGLGAIARRRKVLNTATPA